MPVFKVQRKNGQVQAVEATSHAEAISVVEQMDGGAASRPPTPPSRPGVVESFVRRGVEGVRGLGRLASDAASASVGVSPETGLPDPTASLTFLPKLAKNVYEGVVEGGGEAIARQFPKGVDNQEEDADFYTSVARGGAAAVPIIGPYVMNKVGDVEEGDWRKVTGETALDFASAVAGKLGKVVKRSPNVKGGSPILRQAEELGIEPKRRGFGLSDQPAHNPLEGAPGDPATILRRSVEAANPELRSLGAGEVSDIQNLDQLRRSVKEKLSGVKDARVKAALDKGRSDVASKVGEPIDPTTAGDSIVARVKSGRKAASNTLGPAVTDAKAPFLKESLDPDELARVAGKYGQEFPGVTDATGKILFDEGTGLTYGSLDDIKRKLGYAGSDKNRAASSLSRELQDTALSSLENRGLDVSKIREANANYKTGYSDIYQRGRPGKILKTAEAGNVSQALKIPLTEGRAWEQVVQAIDDPVNRGGGAAAAVGGDTAKEALRRSVVHNNMGLSQGVETFGKNWRSASPRMKAVVFGAQEANAIDDILRNFDDDLTSAKTRPGTANLDRLIEVWDQYEPTKNVFDSPFNPTSKFGLARLLGAATARGGARTLRTGLYQATRLGKPALLYNLVAQQTRLDRKRPKGQTQSDFKSFEDFVKEKEPQS